MINTHSLHNELISDFSSKPSILVINCFPEILRQNFKTFRATEVKYFVVNCRNEWEYILEYCPWRGKRVFSHECNTGISQATVGFREAGNFL